MFIANTYLDILECMEISISLCLCHYPSPMQVNKIALAKTISLPLAYLHSPLLEQHFVQEKVLWCRISSPICLAEWSLLT